MEFRLGDMYKNIPKINTRHLKLVLPFYIIKSFNNPERRTPLMIHGYFGEGKTAIIGRICEEIAREMNLKYYEDTRYWEVEGNRLHLNTLIASNLDPSETKGMPDVKDVYGVKVTEWALPWWWVPESAGENVHFTLFLDELNCAQSFQWTTLREAVNKGVLGGVKCARRSAFLSAVNPPEYSSDVQQELSLPFLNRFCHLYVEGDYDDWREWALGYPEEEIGESVKLAIESSEVEISTRIDPRIIGFLEMHKGTKLKEIITESDRDRYIAVPTPRTWHLASQLIKGIPLRDDTMDLVTLLVASAVGLPMAREFRTFLALFKEVGDPEIILSNPREFYTRIESKPRHERVGMIYIATFNISDFVRRIITDDRLDKEERVREFGKVVNFLKVSKEFASEIPPHEMLIIACSMIPKKYSTRKVEVLGAWKRKDAVFKEILVNSALIAVEANL